MVVRAGMCIGFPYRTCLAHCATSFLSDRKKIWQQRNLTYVSRDHHTSCTFDAVVERPTATVHVVELYFVTQSLPLMEERSNSPLKTISLNLKTHVAISSLTLLQCFAIRVHLVASSEESFTNCKTH